MASAAQLGRRLLPHGPFSRPGSAGSPLPILIPGVPSAPLFSRPSPLRSQEPPPTPTSSGSSTTRSPAPSKTARSATGLLVANYFRQDYKAKELGGRFPFQIQDKEGTSCITLTKRDQKEQIEVEAFLPSPVDSADQNGEQERQAEDDNRQGQYYIPLMVKIHKGSVSLEISCSSYPDELIIESLAFGLSDESVLSSVEAKLSTLPEELQKAFYSYLKSRGISEDVTDFLHAYMINKECHEYLSWLRKLKSLIKS